MGNTMIKLAWLYTKYKSLDKKIIQCTNDRTKLKAKAQKLTNEQEAVKKQIDELKGL